MTERDTDGTRWFREEKARREREAAEKAALERRKAMEALSRLRAAADRARQDSFEPGPSAADEERALLERIIAEPDARSRERLERELAAVRERMRREAARRAPGGS